MTDDHPRLIERAFCLKEASINSVHEKMCHSGHIKAIHIWPARRPLAACRATIIATLLKDPDSMELRKEILKKIGGEIVQIKGKDNQISEKTVGGILSWKSENNPEITWLRKAIAEQYLKPPSILDPFAGGGAIPFESMRMGCEATASDINPVAWFILKCTLDYPHSFFDKLKPLPDFAEDSDEFWEEFPVEGRRGKNQKKGKKYQSTLAPGSGFGLGWHVRAWSWRVLTKVRDQLSIYYTSPTESKPLAYIWARTVKCKNCRSEIPLLKSLWLSRNNKNRILLVMKPNQKEGQVDFEIEKNIPAKGVTPNQKKEYDKRIGKGTIGRSGAWCPCCGLPSSIAMDMEDIRHEGLSGRIGYKMIVIVAKGEKEKIFADISANELAQKKIFEVYSDVPFGLPTEPTPKGGNGASRAFSVDRYGYNAWYKLFTPRQLLSFGVLIKEIRKTREEMAFYGYSPDWIEAVSCYLACILDKIIDYNSTLVHWQPKGVKGSNTFARWALPVKPDFVENALLTSDSGGWMAVSRWVTTPILGMLVDAAKFAPKPKINIMSAVKVEGSYDLVITDPPYYDAIPYSDLMDFFYVWLRRTLYGLTPEIDQVFKDSLSPKWDTSNNDGELIDDPNRHSGDQTKSKETYEFGMARAFGACNNILKANGRLVLVFANKNPEAWETLVGAVIKAGFVVEGSWPMQTEMVNRTRSLSSAALSSSVWLVCRKRITTGPGWDNQVLEDMRANIFQRLHEFWDAGIRGPDFVWTATGPALEAYSKYAVVKKANKPNETMGVDEFLRQVRRIVVDFVVGRVLSKDENGNPLGLDDVTTYYLLHRNDFDFRDTPIGPCILYAISCGLSDGALISEYDLLKKTGGQENLEDDETVENEDEGEGEGSTVRLKGWNQRKGKNLGLDVNGKPAPLIDRIHHLMQLWYTGDEVKVSEYLDDHGLLLNPTFHQVLQAVIELAKEGDEERSILESISNFVSGKGGNIKRRKTLIDYSS
ncbi:DUF1156 domain-containing protein [Candidatus Bathyarchaeota archaeon]|nr:DUF1156 domain-containing protein [Candidatus Bathyarchaeota archaeon]